jgi:hypothetical protein
MEQLLPEFGQIASGHNRQSFQLVLDGIWHWCLLIYTTISASLPRIIKSNSRIVCVRLKRVIEACGGLFKD